MRAAGSDAGRIVLVFLGLATSIASAAPARPTPAALRTARTHFKQGRAYQEAGAWADAIRSYEQAFALAPLPELQYNIGQCHRLAGDKPRALAAYQRYLALAPEGALADEARAHLATLRLRIQVPPDLRRRPGGLPGAERLRRGGLPLPALLRRRGDLRQRLGVHGPRRRREALPGPVTRRGPDAVKVARNDRPTRSPSRSRRARAPCGHAVRDPDHGP